MNIPIELAASIPPNTAVPPALRLLSAAPAAISSRSTPSMKAIQVTTTPRARRRPYTGHVSDGGERRRGREAGGGAAVPRGRLGGVLGGEALGSGPDLGAGDGADRHPRASAAANVNLPDGRNVAAIGCLALD